MIEGAIRILLIEGNPGDSRMLYIEKADSSLYRMKQDRKIKA